MPNGNPQFTPSASLPECHNRPADPRILVTDAVVKVPVVLAEITVQANMDALITFPEPVLEIKDIKKRLKLTQCRLFLTNDNGLFAPGGKLFLKGFVRKNIQYVTPFLSTEATVSSFMKSLTIDVPFQCVTVIDEFSTPPQPFLPSGREEFEFFSSTPLPSGFPAKDRLLSGDFTEFNQSSFENFNELPFCELISSRIVEFDEILDRTMGLPNGTPAPFEEGTFTQIEEKMVVDITLKVLQNQQVRIAPPPTPTPTPGL